MRTSRRSMQTVWSRPVAAGNVVITATSVETGVIATCTLTVVDMTGKPVSTAYTVSAKHDALYSFNPSCRTPRRLRSRPSAAGTNITGLAYDYEGGLYYVVNEGGLPYIYYYDLTSKQTTLKGQVYTFTDANDLAYDPVNKVLYVVAGFYLFQFNPSRMDPTQLNYWTAYRDMSGMTNIPSPRTVACKDGNVYVLARGYGNTELTARMWISPHSRSLRRLTSWSKTASTKWTTIRRPACSM